VTELREGDRAEPAAVDGGRWGDRLWADVKNAFKKHAQGGPLGIGSSALTRDPVAGWTAYAKCQVHAL
jgi:hypothetical protein